jgi:hypothetical protein
MYIDSKGRETAVICVCPIKNEAWILERFLTLASKWADYIVIADQCSTDRSPEIAKSFEKVIYVLNEGEYDERKRSILMLNEVRKIKADKKLVVTLDADEALTLNWDKCKEWDLMLEAEPKTVFNFNWINLINNELKKAINIPETKLAYIDDGESSFDLDIFFHASRVPNITNPTHITLFKLGILHFQYLATYRYYQKNAWYQCKEINDGNKNYISIFRSYHKHINPYKNFVIDVKPYWVKSETFPFDIRIHEDEKELNWYGKEVVDLFLKHGTYKFQNLNIWKHNWFKSDIALKNDNQHLKDPRSLHLKIIHKWLVKTQDKNGSLYVRIIQKLISYFL